jgi:signal transduction histidine kinase
MSDALRRLPHRLYLRIYLALLVSVALAAILFGVASRMNNDPAQLGGHLQTFAELAAETLPPADAPLDEQRAALLRWRPRMHADMTLYDARLREIARVGQPLPPPDPEQAESGWLGGRPPVFALKLPDGRWLVGKRARPPHRPPVSLLAALGMIALAIGIGAYPVVRRLTRRLERLQVSVEALGAGQLSARVAVEGRDEVAALATSFNRSAARIEALMAAQKALLANASHELRSPLARLRMAVELMREQAAPSLQDELTRNIAELDQLVDEILLASRLDSAGDSGAVFEQVDLTSLVAQECAHAGARLSAQPVTMRGDARLLRRMVRNLIENAQRYGNGTAVDVLLGAAEARVTLDVCDRGSGVPDDQREKIFEPFYRMPGTRERDGGVGLGLSLVRQIARTHGGTVACLGREGGGTCFRVTLPGL